jgi:two-component system chemotaxis sensor kinase CheA
MQPMRKVFSKFPRMVRDLARKKKKEINLDISGEDTEVDRSIIEEIGDPLVHMIRNSIDHGIEIPDFREPLGKPEKGLIRLCASYEGDHIIIEVSDDGKGLDPAKLRKTSVEKGILSEEEAEKLSDKESLNLIFAPGFSTAERVTDTSGRGVGMDVVKSNIAKLNGIVNVESTLGEGTKFRIRLPLTVAIIQALMVGAADEIYALSLGSVIETLRVTREEIKTVDDTEVISLRDEILPLTYLATEMGLPRGDDEAAEHMYVVVAGVAEKKIGLVVSKLYGQEEIVIKPLGNYLKGHREFSGATLTGDGKVIMILDVGGLMGVRAVV